MPTLHGFPACSCQVLWIPAFEHELQRRGLIDFPLPIAQLIGGNPSSGGTHTGGGVSDFWLNGLVADRAVAVARQMGADPTWHRLPGWDNGGGVEHVHAVQRGCPHLSSSARAQVGAVDRGGDGLVGDVPDPGPRPLSGRTWQQGIAWAKKQEDDMPAPKDWDAEDYAALLEKLGKPLVKAVWDYAINNAGTKAKSALELLYRNAPKES